jgi:hypothetical protein
MVEVGVKSVTLVRETKELAGDCAESSGHATRTSRSEELTRLAAPALCAYAHCPKGAIAQSAVPEAIATRTDSILIIYDS